MTFPTDEIMLGPQAYGMRKGTEMVVLHTTEGAGPSRQNAIDTIKMQSPGGSLYRGGGSYHWIIYDGGLFLTVPYLESAGSLTSDHTPPTQISPRTGKLGVWSPTLDVKNYLSAAAEADTNAYIITICFSGRAADLAAGRYPANMLVTAAKLILWIEKQAWGPDNVPVFGHRDFQTNRSDPGAGVVDKVLAEYGKIVNPTPVPVPTPDYKALYEASQIRVRTLSTQVGALNARLAVKDKAFDSIVSSATSGKNA